MLRKLERINNGDVALAAETFGDRSHPAMLLIMGATASMLGWPESFCIGLAQQDRFVIRFDHRDTGDSTTGPPGTAGYFAEDLMSDTAAILDALGIHAADVTGMSLGGLIGQMLAVRHPARVRSLTLIGSEPLGWDGAALPHISEAFLEHFAAMGDVDWSQPDSAAGFLVETDRLCSNGSSHFDPIRARALAESVLRRTSQPLSMFNHGTCSMKNGWVGGFRRIECPVLVIHGDRDPILPPANGDALANGITNATLIVLEGTGHEIPAGLESIIGEWISAL